MQLTPARMRTMFNLYPPYIGAGVKVDYFADDWRECRVTMKLRWYNRNAVGTHFGGSLYSMIDPQLMLMIMQLMGHGYYVWDKSASISFEKATREPLYCLLSISDADMAQMHAQTDSGDKYLHHFNLQIREQATEELVAKVEKVIYLRKKPPAKTQS